MVPPSQCGNEGGWVLLVTEKVWFNGTEAPCTVPITASVKESEVAFDFFSYYKKK